MGICGGTAGTISRTVVAPIERYRLLKQVRQQRAFLVRLYLFCGIFGDPNFSSSPALQVGSVVSKHAAEHSGFIKSMKTM